MLANNVNLTIFRGGAANKPARLNTEHKPSGNVIVRIDDERFA